MESRLLAALAQCRLPQLLRGSELMKKTKHRSELRCDRYGNYHLEVSRLEDWERRLLLVGALEEVSASELREKEDRSLIVATVAHDEALKRLLRLEVFPTIPFKENVKRSLLSIPIQGIVQWKRERECSAVNESVQLDPTKHPSPPSLTQNHCSVCSASNVRSRRHYTCWFLVRLERRTRSWSEEHH